MSRPRHAKPRKPILSWIALSALLVLGVLLFAGQYGWIGFRALTVQSGSMEPSIPRNSVVLTTPPTDLAVGDVVTYELPDQPEILITHRIAEIRQEAGETLYITKGDANDDVDEDLLTRSSIVGEVRLTIPWIGAVINWVRTDVGFIALIIVPATIIVYNEILSLRQQFRDRRSKGARGSPAHSSSSVELSGSSRV